jgi:hypothetical protein
LFTFRFPKYPFLIRLPYLTLAPRSPFKFCYLQFYFSLIISFLFSKFSQVLNRGSRVGGCGPFLLFFSVVSLPLLLFHLALQPESAISYLAGEDPIDFYSRHFWEHPITEISQILLSSNIVSRGSGNLSMMLLSNDRSFVFRSMTAHFCSRTRNYNFHFFLNPPISAHLSKTCGVAFIPIYSRLKHVELYAFCRRRSNRRAHFFYKLFLCKCWKFRPVSCNLRNTLFLFCGATTP